MKKLLSFGFVGSLLVLVQACSKSDGNNTTPPPTNPTTTVDVRGTITSDTKWTSDKKYRLRGWVYVKGGAKLTIEPGTQIVSNKDSAGVLLIYKGSQILAEGTADKPIVFTSNETAPAPGDFGGLILVGQATGNGNHASLEGNPDTDYKTFGGTNDADNSGILKYVRIEYPGKAVNPNDEVNGLSLYAVGSGTTIDYVQVTRSQDDAIEIFGGAVNLKHIIAYNNADDDFDFDDGYHGKIQYAISIKDKAFTDNKTGGDLSNNFEVDNTNGKIAYNTTPITSPILSNFTAIGPNIDPANTAGTKFDDYGYGMRWRRGCKFILANSIVMGAQKAGLSLEIAETGQFYKDGTSKFYNSFLHAVTNPFRVADGANTVIDSLALATLTLTTNKSQLLTAAADIKLTDPFNNSAPNLKPQSGSLALTTAAKFDVGGLNDAFFDKVNFVGALDASNDWTAKWTSWGK